MKIRTIPKGFESFGSRLPRNVELKDNGLYIFTLIHIYIYFNILLSYLNSGH